jgi:A/G-specific adenine glycosylase
MAASNTQVCVLEQKKGAFQESVLAWAKSHLRDFPWRQPGARPYEVLLAELLLKRTTAAAAARAYVQFLTKYPTVIQLATATEKDLAQVLLPVGLHQQRAKAIPKLARYLIEEESGLIPALLDQLLKVPGLGPYSARAILSFGFNTPVAVVDANVERILGRVLQDVLPARSSARLLQEVADALVPHEAHRQYNFALLDLGGLVCRYADPLHEECPLKDICDYYQQKKGGLIREEPARYETASGAKLRIVRRQKGFALTRLAKLSGISKLTIIRIESGKTSPRPETLRKLAAVLDVELDQLQ